MKIKELIKKLQSYKNQNLKVIITVGNEHNDILSTSEFELLNKDEIYEYIEIFINKDICIKQL